MKRIAYLLGGAFALAGLALNVGSLTAPASRGYTTTPRGFVMAQEFSEVGRQRLKSLDPVSMTLLGSTGGHSYIEIAKADGETCYGATTGTAGSRNLLDVMCFEGADAMEVPLLDMSTVAVDPATGVVLRVDRVEGIAADEVAEVGIESAGRIVATVPVVANVYAFDPAALPYQPEAIVALSPSGDALWRKRI